MKCATSGLCTSHMTQRRWIPKAVQTHNHGLAWNACVNEDGGNLMNAATSDHTDASTWGTAQLSGHSFWAPVEGSMCIHRLSRPWRSRRRLCLLLPRSRRQRSAKPGRRRRPRTWRGCDWHARQRMHWMNLPLATQVGLVNLFVSKM